MIGNTIKAVIDTITSFNECVTFIQSLGSLVSCLSGAESQELKEDDVLKLLKDTRSEMHNLFDRAECKSHEERVKELLPELKAVIYDAGDLLDDFSKTKVQIEGSVTSAEPATKSSHSAIQGKFKKLTHMKERLDNLSRMLEGMGLPKAPRFDRSVRPETTSFPTEAIFGRNDDMEKLMRRLGVPKNNRRGSSISKRKRMGTNVPVLPIVGLGGVGKTTLVQYLCNHPQVKKHFDVIAWICVSDDFDVRRLTKEAIEQCSGNTPTKDNLNSLQTDLAGSLKKKKFLIVLDDMWAQDEKRWKEFYAPIKDVPEGSMMLVTTRSQKVADIVRTTDPFPLEGLVDVEFQKFFKQCVFGSDSCSINPELERIGEQILPKLKGSPLAAKILGRLLGMSLDPAHWNMILNSQLWELTQEGTDILPALRLSYIYLPFHLKRCFAFCAVYPKDYNFVKEDLAEIWVAEGFVEAEHNIPLQQIGCKYFEELAHLSFFQKFRGKYVMHDLIHDMAQLVSSDDCFIIKEKKDLERIPQRVRHLSVLKSRDFKCSDLESLCKQTKLRTLLCDMSLKGKIGNNVMEKWCAGLLCMRVMVCASISKSGLPDSISNMKNLRYLKISDACLFDCLPATFCHLYNLQVLSARKCKIQVIPEGFNNLVNLQKFELRDLKIDAGKLNNFNMFSGDLYLCNLCEISKDQAAKLELMKKKEILDVTLDWSNGINNLSLGPQVHNGIEVFKELHPPTTIKFVRLRCYPGEYLPSWFHGSDVPTIFTSLIEITIIDCPSLSSLEQFLQPAYMPAIKKMMIENCTSLVSVPVERFGGLPSLEELKVWYCPKINSQHLQAPSLKKLRLQDSGNLGDDIDCSSLTTFHLSRYQLASLTFNGEKLPRLTDLTIERCPELDTLDGAWPILKSLSIMWCPRLNWENGIVLPSSLQKLHLYDFGYFSVRCLENLTSLEILTMFHCKHIEYIPGDLWRSCLKSLQELNICDFGDLVSYGGPEAIAHIPKVYIYTCPRLKEVQQDLRRGY